MISTTEKRRKKF